MMGYFNTLLLVETLTFTETFFGSSIIIGAYLSLVLWILPNFMKNRKPYQLTRILLLYNAFQVVFSAYAVSIYTKYMFNHGLIVTVCPKGDVLQNVIPKIFPYFIAKHVDLLDTVFFVLRKKDSQVTFLHVFHHAIMITWAWFYYFYHPSDHFVFTGNINSFVHVMMYSYYALSSLGPDYAKYIWWKNYLTKLQLIQFILSIAYLHYQQKLTPCPIPSAFHNFCLFCIISFFFLFLNFYIRNYGTIKKKKMNIINIGCNFDTQKTN